MKRKPAGPKYRNLVAYRDRIFYERVVSGRRYWCDLKSTDWDDAVVLRDRLEEFEGIEKRRGDVPRFDGLKGFRVVAVGGLEPPTYGL